MDWTWMVGWMAILMGSERDRPSSLPDELPGVSALVAVPWYVMHT